MFRPIRVLRVSVVSCAVFSLCLGAAAVGKYQFYLKEGKLVRGTSANPFLIRAVHIPDLADPKTFTPLELTKTLIRISDPGATAVCFDLYGISPDGTALSEDSVAVLNKIIRQITWRQMGAICRVLGESAPTNPEARRAAIRTVAKTAKNDSSILYWIDGPNAAALARAFKKAAPQLIVIAPAGGDLSTATTPGPLSLVVGSIPKPLTSSVDCMMPDSPQTLAAYDKALADPIESEPWTPDNSVLSEQERKDGWIALFDGKTLNGWTITGPNKHGFVARNGAIEWNGRGAYQLRTRNRYGDFIMRFDYKIAKGKNSGVQFRTPRANRASSIGFEFQILGDYGKPPDKHSTGSVYDVVPPKVAANKPDGEWNSVEITLKGPYLKAILNGKVVQDLNFDDYDALRPRLRRGFIVITDHGGYCAYRNLRLKKL